MTYGDLRPTSGPWAEIDYRAIRNNLQWLKQRVARAGSPFPPRIWAVTKADAYGHGLHHALSALQHSTDGFCINSGDDVIRLRQAGWQGPVLLLSACGLSGSDLNDPALGELHLVVDEATQLEMLERCAPGRARLSAWMRFAGRLRQQGFSPNDYSKAFERLEALRKSGRISLAGHLHHYAFAEDPDSLRQERQDFIQTVAALPGPRNTGNSAALCGDSPEDVLPEHWLRCGLLLYGASALPGRNGPDLGLQPAMSLQARLLSVQYVRAGQTVGYGDSYRAPHDTYIGTVGIGYSHGVPRQLSKHGSVMANRTGRRLPLAGRVTMDCLTVDLGPAPHEQAGDIFTLWGCSTGGHLQPVEEVAAACDSIAAELFTGLTSRVPLISRGEPTSA